MGTISSPTFANPYDRVLHGDLYFPLSEGATISGCALDIDGKLIDGVAVEKHKGREVFEQIVRQNIDPGLIEWTKGNNFKTRVFPIPAKGTRTIRVRYVTELVGEVTVQVDVFTNYGRISELHKSITVRLKEAKDTIDIGQIDF